MPVLRFSAVLIVSITALFGCNDQAPDNNHKLSANSPSIMNTGNHNNNHSIPAVPAVPADIEAPTQIKISQVYNQFNQQLNYTNKQNICPEESIIVAAKVLGIKAIFNIKNNHDPIDIVEPTLTFIDKLDDIAFRQEYRLVLSDIEEDAINFLAGLNPSEIYVMRNGQEGLGGHNQVLIHYANHWYCSTGADTAELLTRNSKLTHYARNRMLLKSTQDPNTNHPNTWTVAPLSEDTVKKLVVYLQAYRVLPQNVPNAQREVQAMQAVEKAYSLTY